LIGSHNPSKIDIVFTPPDPTVSLWATGTPSAYEDSTTIILRLKDDNTKTKTISVNKVGLVEIQ